MTTKFRRVLSAFWRAKSGNIAMIFAISLVPLALAAGAGLDFAHAMMVRENIADALDASALAVGGQPNLSAAQSLALAQQVFNANYTAGQAINPTTHLAQNPQVAQPVITNGTVTLTLAAPFQVPTTLLAVIGETSLPVQVSTTVKWGQTKLWVALVLDNTGSMCQPDNNPCPGDTNPNTKINTLKSASQSLLTTLQNASTNPGDVQVAIVPFAKDVNIGTSYSGASWIDWTDWSTPIPGNAPSSSVGPGSTCPWRNSSYNNCLSQPGGVLASDGVTMTTVSTVPSSGLICPGSLISSSAGQAGHYYDGCYNSVQNATVVAKTVTTPTITGEDTCTTINGGTASCTANSGYPKTLSATTNTTTSTVPNYTGNSTVTAPPVVTTNTSNSSQSCKTSRGTTTCTYTSTTTQNSAVTTTTTTAAGTYVHTWQVNDHSTWRGCVMDRNQSDDVNDLTPGTLFPAENDDSCPPAHVALLSYNWTNLSTQINAMVASGGTNQTIGLAHGMQMLVSGDPYDAPALPANTSRYIILLSDGLNTMDRWYGDGSDQSTQVDARMTLTCANAKSQGFIIYTVFVDLGGTQGNSSVLQSCASDSSKYYDLTTAGAIVTTFNQIGEQITNLRVSD